MTPKYPLLGPENQFPNISLAVICVIAIAVYFVAIFSVVIGASYLVSELARYAFGG